MNTFENLKLCFINIENVRQNYFIAKIGVEIFGRNDYHLSR